MVCRPGSNPCQSYSPVPRTGKSGEVPAARFGYQPESWKAMGLVEVVDVVLAEDLGERVDIVRRGGGGAPRIVATVAELDHQVDAREGGAAGVEAGPVQVLLHQDLGHEIAHLRPQHADG